MRSLHVARMPLSVRVRMFYCFSSLSLTSATVHKSGLLCIREDKFNSMPEAVSDINKKVPGKESARTFAEVVPNRFYFAFATAVKDGGLQIRAMVGDEDQNLSSIGRDFVITSGDGEGYPEFITLCTKMFIIMKCVMCYEPRLQPLPKPNNSSQILVMKDSGEEKVSVKRVVSVQEYITDEEREMGVKKTISFKENKQAAQAHFVRLQEIHAALSAADYPFTFWDLSVDGDSVSYLMKRYEHFSLRDTFRRTNKSEKQVFDAYLERLESLKRHHLIHRDCRLANMAWDPELEEIVLIDFDMAIVSREPLPSSSIKGFKTHQYISTSTYLHEIDLKASRVELGM